MVKVYIILACYILFPLLIIEGFKRWTIVQKIGTVVLAYSGVDKDTLPGKTYFGVPADEAMKKWREIATLKSLPDLIAKLDK